MNDRLDTELAALRDALHAEARHDARSEDALADVKAGVTTVTRPPRRRPMWVAGAVVLAAAAAAVGVVVLSNDDRDGVTVPVTDPTIATTAPETTAAPDTTTPPSTALPTTTDVAVHTTVPVPSQSVTSVRSISFSDTDGGWAIVEQGEGRPSLIRTDMPGLAANWVIADSPAPAADLMEVRFADALNGWLIGAQRWWSTHDGGATWNELPLADSGDAPLDVVVAGGWALVLRAEQSDAEPFAVRVWRSPIGTDDFQPTDAVHPKGAGGNDVQLAAAFDGTDVLLSFNDRGGSTFRLRPDGSMSGWITPATGRGGDIVLESAPGGGAVWALSQTGAWGGDADPTQVVSVAAAEGQAFRDVVLPETVDLTDVGVRLCGLGQFDDGSTALVMCDVKGARQYRSTDLGATWESIGTATGGNEGDEWSWGGGASPQGPMVLSVSHTSAETTNVSNGIWAIVNSTDAWLSILGG